MLEESGNKKAKQILTILEDPTGFFATTQLYITVIALFAGAYAAGSFTEPAVAWVLGMGVPVSESVAEPIVFILSTIILTYFMLVFGELVPKRIALRNAMGFAFTVIGFLNVLSKIVLPFVRLLSVSANGILRLIGIKDEELEEKVTKEEIRMILRAGSEHGSIAESEHDILSNILKLSNKTVENTCIHRIDIAALPVTAKFSEIIALLINEKYSRVPIYEDSIDNILGILHMKDVMKYMVDNPDTSGFNIKTLLREPYFVPSSKKAGDLLNEMQKDRVYIAIVIDEHGGTMGLVTMEDLIEEIVGSISDEHDPHEPPDIAPAGDNIFIIQGMTSLEKVQNHFDTALPIDEYDTLSGFLIGQLKRIPGENEKSELQYNGLLFKVESMRENRISIIKVIVLSEKPTEDESGG